MNPFCKINHEADLKFTQYVEYRIIEWAKWFNNSKSYAAGYPKRSIEHRLMIEGIIIKQHGPLPVPYHEDAEEIEYLVKDMSRRYPKQATALRIHYLNETDNLKLAASRFRIYVDMAKFWIASRLSEDFKQ